MTLIETTVRTEELPPVIVDRSIELARAPRGPIGDKVLFTLDGTEDWIKVSARGDGEICVLANALRQLYPGCEPHIEGENPYLIRADGGRITIQFNAEMIEMIGRWDRGDPDAFAGGFLIT